FNPKEFRNDERAVRPAAQSATSPQSAMRRRSGSVSSRCKAGSGVAFAGHWKETTPEPAPPANGVATSTWTHAAPARLPPRALPVVLDGRLRVLVSHHPEGRTPRHARGDAA